MNDTFENWVLDRFDHDDLKMMSEHGSRVGFPGLISLRETTALYEKYKEDIWGILNDKAASEATTILKMISNFYGADNIDDPTSFESSLTHYAVEQIADIYIYQF